MDNWFPSQLSKCHPAPKHTPPWAPLRGRAGGTEQPVVSPPGLCWEEEQEPRGASVSLFRGYGTLPGYVGARLPAPWDSGPEDKRADPGARLGVSGGGDAGQDLSRGCLPSPPPIVLGFWAEVSWLIWVPISGRLSCHWLLKNNPPLDSGHDHPFSRRLTGVWPCQGERWAQHGEGSGLGGAGARHPGAGPTRRVWAKGP